MVRRGETLDAKAVGGRVRQARQEAGGMTQVELAQMIGVRERSISAIERGEWIPYRHMSKLEDIFEKPHRWFLYGDAVPGADPGMARLEAKLDKIIELLEKKPPRKRGGAA
jgi:DNA-binding XRE family transcriptional regulator